MRGRRVAFFVIFGVLVPLGACGTNAIGVDVCNQIESARCNRAASLAASGTNCTLPDSSIAIDFLAPFADAGTATENAAACIRFYSIACLHGLVTPVLPNSTQVAKCLMEINEGGPGCAVVADPTGEAGGGACQWLLEAGPPEAGDGGVPDVVTVTDTGVIIDTGVILDTGRNFEACPEAGCLP